VFSFYFHIKLSLTHSFTELIFLFIRAIRGNGKKKKVRKSRTAAQKEARNEKDAEAKKIEHEERGFLVNGKGEKPTKFWISTDLMQEALAAATESQLADYFTQVYEQFNEGPVPVGIDNLTQALNQGNPVARSLQKLGKFSVIRFDEGKRKNSVLICSYNKENGTIRVLAIVSNASLAGRLFQGRQHFSHNHHSALVLHALESLGYSSLITKGPYAGYLQFGKVPVIAPAAST
jgi:hypothetical protein